MSHIPPFGSLRACCSLITLLATVGLSLLIGCTSYQIDMSHQVEWTAEQRRELTTAMQERAAAVAAATQAIQRYCSLNHTVDSRLHCLAEKQLDLQIMLQFTGVGKDPTYSRREDQLSSSQRPWFVCAVNPLRTRCEREGVDALTMWRSSPSRSN